MNLNSLLKALQTKDYAKAQIMVEEAIREEEVKKSGRNVNRYKKIKKILEKNFAQYGSSNGMNKTYEIDEHQAVFVDNKCVVFMKHEIDELPKSEEENKLLLNLYRNYETENKKKLKLPAISQIKADKKIYKDVYYKVTDIKKYNINLCVNVKYIIECLELLEIKNTENIEFYYSHITGKEPFCLKCENGIAYIMPIHSQIGKAERATIIDISSSKREEE